MTKPKPGWPRVRFGDVVRLNTDRSADPAADGIERYVGIEHIEPEDLRIRSWGLVAEGTTFTQRIRPGQTLFVKRRAYQRKVAVAEFDAVCSGDIYVLEPRDDRLLPELLPFLCQTDAFFEHAVNTSAGSLSPRTNWTQLAQYEFALPPLAEQRRIVRVLNTSKQALEAGLQLIEQGQALLQAYAKHRLAIHQEQHLPRKVTELTQKITVGIVLKPASWYVSSGEGIPALRSLNVLPGRLEFSDLVYISEEGHQVYQKAQLHPGDIVVVRSGRPGDAAVIPGGIGSLNCIDLVIVTPNERLLPHYLVAYLNSPYGRQKIAAGIVGTAQKHFNVTTFEKLKIPCPPLGIQKLFVSQLGQLEAVHALSAKRHRNTQQVHQYLLNYLLQGSP